MSQMRVKKIFIDTQNRKVMEINVLPSKYCTFGCVFCPIGQKGEKTDKTHHFDETEAFLPYLEREIEVEKPDVLFINSMGESFLNSQLEEIVFLVKDKNLRVSLYTNGHLLGYPQFAKVALLCDETSGEIKATTEEDFRKYQRPLERYTLEEYWKNMIGFRERYKGEFVVYVTLIRGVNDNPESIECIKNVITKLDPSRVFVETFEDEKFGKAFGVSAQKLSECSKVILSN